MSEYANQHDGSPLWLWAVVTDWLLDAGARRGARIALADLAAQRAGYDLAELTWKQRSALRRAAADLLITEREIALRESVNTDRQAQLDMARRRLEAGAPPPRHPHPLGRDAPPGEPKPRAATPAAGRPPQAAGAPAGGRGDGGGTAGGAGGGRGADAGAAGRAGPVAAREAHTCAGPRDGVAVGAAGGAGLGATRAATSSVRSLAPASKPCAVSA